MSDFLIIRNKCDTATEYTNWIGEGLKEFLETKGYSVTDLSDMDASPENVLLWLKTENQKTMRAVVALDHGSDDAFWGEKNGALAQVLNLSNVEITKQLHVYTLACSTMAQLGVTAISKGCYSWLGYTEPVYAAHSDSFKQCIWSYVVAMAEGKTMEQCQQVLHDAYLAHKDESFIYQYNLDRMKLGTSVANSTILSHTRYPAPGAGYASQLDLDYIVGNPVHCLWSLVQGKYYYKWVNNNEIQTAVRPAFQAPKVWIEYSGQGEITRIRRVKA